MRLPLHELRPPREWVINHLVNRVPLLPLRLALLERAGVRFEDRRSTLVMIGAEINAPERLSLGHHSSIGPRSLLDARGGIQIGANVNISGGAQLITGTHDIDDPEFTALYRPIVVHDRAWIASNAIVLGGVTLGEGAVVSAGAVVTRDVEEWTVVGGCPARLLRRRPSGQTYTLSWRPRGWW